jgi:hypothetical protein
VRYLRRPTGEASWQHRGPSCRSSRQVEGQLTHRLARQARDGVRKGRCQRRQSGLADAGRWLDGHVLGADQRRRWPQRRRARRSGDQQTPRTFRCGRRMRLSRPLMASHSRPSAGPLEQLIQSRASRILARLVPPTLEAEQIKLSNRAWHCRGPGCPSLCFTSHAHYPAMTSRCIQSSSTVGSMEGLANKAYWLAPKTPGK